MGTSLPELATSVVAAFKGERDIAVGNVVGSNIFNILLIMGLTSLAAPKDIVVPDQCFSRDLPIMIGATLVCLPVFFTGKRISRGEGALFLTAYAGYVFLAIAWAKGLL